MAPGGGGAAYGSAYGGGALTAGLMLGGGTVLGYCGTLGGGLYID